LWIFAWYSDEVDRYVMWAAGEVRAEEDEALVLTVDQALEQFFQRDKLFQDTLGGKTKMGSGTMSGALWSASQQGDSPGTGSPAASPSRRLV
jgi:hypothetical protein